MTQSVSNPSVEVIIYYHYSEMGRSPNTAHVLPIIAPDLVSKTLIFGDVEEEWELFQSILDEHQRNIHRTCILYPSYHAVPVTQWLHTQIRSNSDMRDLPIRMILLDGTYSHSTKQIKFLQNHFQGTYNILFVFWYFHLFSS